MSDQAMLVQDLRELIARREVVLVVGTGVSVAATAGAPTAAWKGLLLSGVKWCQELNPELPVRWAGRRKEDIEQGTTAEMIAAADLITDELMSVSRGEFENWLEKEVGALKIKDRSVLDALVALGLPFITTNYDHLIEEATSRPAISWKESSKVERLLRDWESGVLHLHGKWDQPDSVVLGVKSYEIVKEAPHVQTVLKALRAAKTLLFVGCAEGLRDPNFGNFLSWTRSVFADSPYRQFCLVRKEQQTKLQQQHPPGERLFFVSYGKKHEDLVPFLRSLTPKKSSPAVPRAKGGATKPARGGKTLSPAVAGYLQRLAEETRYLRMIGLAKNRQIELEIKDAYVPLRTMVTRSLESRHPGHFPKKALKEMGQAEEDIPLRKMFAVARRFKKRGVILLGEPGAGKTTGARQLCWLLASARQSPADLSLPAGIVPVFLQLRNLESGDVGKGFKDFVVRETRDDGAPEHEADPGLELWNRRPILWVFDGLDEVVSEAARVKISKRIQDFLRTRREDYVLVTSRYQGYGEKVELGTAFLQFHVQPLEQDQVETFVDCWFHAAYRELFGDRPKVAREVQADADQLKRLLSEQEYTSGGLRELRTNPLLLSVVCLVYRLEHALPRGRAALYERCVTVLLESWHKGLSVQPRTKPFEAEAARRVLAQLAWWMHCQSESEAGGKPVPEDERRGSPAAAIADMAKAVARPLAETAERAGLGRDGKRFVERMRDESGILVTARPACCSFLHLTFQEYLAATHAVAEGLAGELVARLGKSWWRETILLALARASGPFVREFFTAFLNAPAWDADRNFASACLDEAAVTSLDPFLAKLKSVKTDDGHKIRILQLLRQKDDPALLKVCRTLAGSKQAPLASAAREILERAKAPGAVEVVEKPAAEIAAAATPGQVHVDPHNGIAFVVIPAGEFAMGSNRDSSDKPIHRVRISQPFLLGRYAVTNQEYARFLKEAKRKTLPEYWNNKNFNQPQQPVVGVSWEDAQAFCAWAGCRLPTEAEWEYACRARTTSEFHFGNSLSSEQANFDGNHPFGEAKKGPYLQKTSPVGSYEPNDFGLYDMHGNVWEWCQDRYAQYSSGPVSDPTGPEEGRIRVLRGGSWFDTAANCRSAYRFYGPPSPRSLDIGFRVVLAPRSVPSRTSLERSAARRLGSERGTSGD